MSFLSRIMLSWPPLGYISWFPKFLRSRSTVFAPSGSPGGCRRRHDARFAARRSPLGCRQGRTVPQPSLLLTALIKGLAIVPVFRLIFSNMASVLFLHVIIKGRHLTSPLSLGNLEKLSSVHCLRRDSHMGVTWQSCGEPLGGTWCS